MQCWVHVGRKFTENKIGSGSGLSRKQLAGYHRWVKEIKNCRTVEQAQAVAAVTLNHMRDTGGERVARTFEQEYLHPRWFTWFIGYAGPGFSPNSNPQEAWHRQQKDQVRPSTSRSLTASDGI